MDLDAYVAENAPGWRRLDTLARRRRLTVDEVDEMMALYQRVGTQLSVIRAKAPDALLIAWLSRVVLAARGRLTGVSPSRMRALRDFFVIGFPLAVYQARRWSIAVGVIFIVLSGVLIQYIATHPSIQHMFATSDDARELVDSGFANYYTEYPAHHFALQVWTNNSLLTAQCLAAGVLIVPVIYLLYTNLLNVGVDGGFMTAYGKSGEFYGLILPHGMLELTCVFIGAGAGMRIGWTLISPAPGLTRLRSAAEAARAAMLVALGLAIALGVSGLIEAFVTPSPLSTSARITIGASVWFLFIVYVGVLGRRAQAAAASADLDDEARGASLASV
jgi:uncharacterized membrane protein SpoIIM required for sporulation